MKKIIIILAVALLGVVKSNAQCSPAANNFEMKLVPNKDNTLTVKIRYNDGAVNNAVSTLPSKDLNLNGLAFAITWPSSSDIKIESCDALLAPFSVDLDRSMGTSAQNKVAAIADNIQTFYHTNSLPVVFGFDWENNKWNDIATIHYTGTLAQGDFFSFMNCDYGLAHPNSYSGNSYTDPWFEIVNLTTMSFEQYAPKMLTEVPGTISNVTTFNIYPNPTSSELYIDIASELNTQVVANITDVNGKVVTSSVFKLEKGNNKNKMNLGDLPNGNYIVKITDGKTLNYIQKVAKQ
jgi:hypothetical protein